MAYKVNVNKVEKSVQDAAIKQASFRDGPSLKWYKMASDKATLRIMPPWTNEGPFEGQFWRVIHQHWNVTEEMKAPIICPKTTPYLGGDCVICDYVAKLRETNDPAALELAKDIRDKQAYLFTVVDVLDPEYTVKDVSEFKKKYPDKKEIPFSAGEPKLQVYAAPFGVFNSIINLYQTGFDLVDLDAGHNIVLTKTAKGGKKMNVQYNVMPIPKPSKSNVPSDHPLIDLTKAGVVLTEEKMLAYLETGVGAEGMLDCLPTSNTKSLPAGNTSKSPKVDDNEDDDNEELAYDDSRSLEEDMLSELGD
jgi:hypothetical protein